MRNPAAELANVNRAIEYTINRFEREDRGVVARDLIGNLRHLTEHVAVYAIYGGGPISEDYYKAVKSAVSKMKTCKATRFIWDFHHFLQKVVSHYVATEDSAERLLLKYYESLLLLKRYAAGTLGISILDNLGKIPLDIDPGLVKYHESIARMVDGSMIAHSPSFGRERFYVRNIKPFFVASGVYYETTLVPAYDSTSKFDRILAFSAFRIPTSCAVIVSTTRTSVAGLGINLPVIVVDDYMASVRPCEINALLKVLGRPDLARVNGTYSSYRSLMSFITRTGLDLCEIATLPDGAFANAMADIAPTGSACPVHTLLGDAHAFLKAGGGGCNVLRYLLSKPRNRVIKDQLADAGNELLGGLFLQYGCVPFDQQPYCTSLIGHEIAAGDLYRCIDPEPYQDNILARSVSERAIANKSLYLKDSDFSSFESIDELVGLFNRNLYYKHRSRSLVHDSAHLFVKGDEDDVVEIIEGLLALSQRGLKGYASTCASWLGGAPSFVDDSAKADALKIMFVDTRVALIYGSAGTGKTTMVNIVCALLNDLRKIAIANTNPAVDSLRRRIGDARCEFMTVAKYLNHPMDSDILIVDECSTVCNRDMRRIVKNGGFKLLVLVGDERQIESIRFGNWFSLAREFLPAKCIHEFKTPWRTTNNGLLRLWGAVRSMDDDVAEILAACDFSMNLDGTVANRENDDEIVLCLNYDGLYGINNMNKILQTTNSNEPISWNLHTYKVGDPILFNETERFRPLLYNNLKGRIAAIDRLSNDEVAFTVDVELSVTELSVCQYPGLEYVDSRGGKTRLRFSVKKAEDSDGEDIAGDCVVPFQVAYAVSVHKAQGLEYSSVKLIVTKDVEERITHNVFYTAITRARDTLRIYWSPESQKKVLSGFELSNARKDACLLSSRRGLQLQPCR